MTFAEARAQFPLLERLTYLNAGTFGPLAASTVSAMRRELELDEVEGRSGDEFFHGTLARREELRSELARLVAADPLHVALTTSTTDGCNIVVRGLGLTSGDEVVTTSGEHFGLLGALRVSPARVVVAAPDPDAILAAVTPRTRLLALSQVLWTTGQLLPVAELRARSGVPVLVDGAQSVGAMPVDVAGLDFLTISGQKWLCGPDSTGALVVAEPEHLALGAPSYLSQRSHERDGSFVAREGAARFDSGWWPRAAVAGLRAALATRPTWAYRRALATADRCRSLLERRYEVVTPLERSTLVSFAPREDPVAVVARLAAHGVQVREIPGSGLVRVSCGWWTSDDDLDRLVESLE